MVRALGNVRLFATVSPAGRFGHLPTEWHSLGLMQAGEQQAGGASRRAVVGDVAFSRRQGRGEMYAWVSSDGR